MLCVCVCVYVRVCICVCVTQVDSKKELEKQLKGVCEAFIMAVTKIAVEPMLSFITKVRYGTI